MELTKTDKAIIEKLREDARQSNRAVGKALGISEETVRRRTHAMVAAGVIHFGITISAAELGYTVAAMLTIKGAGEYHRAQDEFRSSRVVTKRQLFDGRIIVEIAAESAEDIYRQVARTVGLGNEVLAVDFIHEDDLFI